MSSRKPPDQDSFTDWSTYFDLLLKLFRKPRSRTLQESFGRMLRRLDVREPAKRLKLMLEGDRRAWAETLVEATYGPAGGLFVAEVHRVSPFRDSLFAVFALRPDVSSKLMNSGDALAILEALCADPTSVERHKFEPYFYFFAIPRPR